MQDFLLDFRSVWSHITEGGYLEFRELRGDGKFRVSVFVLLGFLNFLGYRIDGWDTEYRVDEKSLRYEGVGWSCRQYVDSKSWSNYCFISGMDVVVDLRGILYSDVMKLEGVMVERCIVPVEVGIYFQGLQEFFEGTKGFVMEKCKSEVYDFSLFDDYELDLSRYYKEMFETYSFSCFGRKFTEWLLLEDVYNHWYRGERLQNLFSIADSLKVNRVYVPGVLSIASDDGRGEAFKEYLESFVKGC